MIHGLDDIREFIAGRVHEGFESAHLIIENAQHWAYEKHGRDDLLPEIKRLTAGGPGWFIAPNIFSAKRLGC